MYLEFFKFNRKPFPSAPDPDAFLLTEAKQEAFERILDAIQGREPCMLLTGEAGTGKTALLKWLMTNDDLGVRWIFLDKAQLNWDDLLMLIGQDLGLPENELFSDHLAEAISGKMVQLAGWDTHPVLIIDEADHIQSGTLRKLLAWHTANQAEDIPLSIIFSGQKNLLQNFAAAGQGLFSAGSFDHFELPRFDPQETSTYISFRLERAGHWGTELFEKEALSLVHDLSGGIPRVINLVCDLGLVLAASIKEPKVTAPTVQEASEYILLEKCVGTAQESPLTQPISTTKEDKPAARNENLAASLSSPLAPQYNRPVGKWGWAAAGLLFLFIGGGTVFWLYSGLMPDKQKITERLVFKVPANTAAKKETQATSPAVSSPRATVPENSRLASVEGRPAFSLALHTSVPASQKATNQAPVSASRENRFKGSMDIEAKNGPARLTAREAEKVSSSAQATTKQPPGIYLNDNPTSETSEENRLRKLITPVSPLLRAPDSRSKTVTTNSIGQTTGLSTSKQKPHTILGSSNVAQNHNLVNAIENGNTEKVRQILENGVSADHIGSTGETALMKAAWAGYRGIVILLLGHEPHINSQSQEGWTALFYATVKGHKDVVETLLTAGAKPDLADQDGRTPLMAAAWNGHTDIAALLLSQNVNPNRKNRDGWTPLMFAALGGHTNMVETLLRGGANPAVRNNEGENSAQLAAHQGHTQLFSLLNRHSQP